MRPMKLLLAFALAFTQPVHAQFRDWLSGNTTNNGSTVAEFLRVAEKLNTPQSKSLEALRGKLGLVFVPGILGSALKTASGEAIWGYGLTLSPHLELPAALIDPAMESGVRAELADGRAGRLDLYGTAMDLIREHAVKAGIPSNRIAACGYDWRRDVRAGARELARCIERAPELQGVEALVVIAHSMGGVVTTQWHRDYAPEGRLGNGTEIIALAMLGSPLAGSCEILRMVATGYVQPKAGDRHANESWLGRFATDIATMRDRVVNAVTGFFSQPVRPLVLSWPGALELAPPPAERPEQPNCAEVLRDPNGTDPALVSHFDVRFWEGEPGRSLVAGATPPPAWREALAKAREFREGFAVAPLATPTYLFASQIWDTPAQPKLVSPTYVPDDRGDWHTVNGDGRVPWVAAMPSVLRERAADARGVYSVHGNLAEDRVFLEEFFGERLPRLLQGWRALRLVPGVLADDAWLRVYLGAGGQPLHPVDLYAAWERQDDARQRDPVYGLTVRAWNAALDFNDALCRVSSCPGYAAARDAARKAAEPERAAIYTGALGRERGLTAEQDVFLIAKRGLEMAKALNWVAAIGDLRYAVPQLMARADRLGTREKEGERELRLAAAANLARALVLRGFCAEAAGYFAMVSEDNRWAKDARRAQCFDRDTGRIVSLAKP